MQEPEISLRYEKNTAIGIMLLIGYRRGCVNLRPCPAGSLCLFQSQTIVRSPNSEVKQILPPDKFVCQNQTSHNDSQ